MGRSRHHPLKKENHGRITTDIDRECSTAVKDRAVPDHWAGDLLRVSETVKLPLFWSVIDAITNSGITQGKAYRKPSEEPYSSVINAAGFAFCWPLISSLTCGFCLKLFLRKSPIETVSPLRTTIFFPQLISSFSDFRIVDHCHSCLSRYLIPVFTLADPDGMCSWLILSLG